MKINRYDGTLPEWLDNIIFKELKATYKTRNTEFAERDSDSTRSMEYLGTYFPRSYVESYCIFSDLFLKQGYFQNAKTLNIFDWGCGSGGATMGLLAAIDEMLPSVTAVKVRAIDGNSHDAEICRMLLNRLSSHTRLKIQVGVECKDVEHKDDFAKLYSDENEKLDIVLTFKALGELLLRGVAVDWNPYSVFVDTFSNKLNELPNWKDSGVICIGEHASQLKGMDCPRRTQHDGICPICAEGCPVARQLEFCKAESRNDRSEITGECRACATECFAYVQGGVVERACGKKLECTYYRDLLNTAVRRCHMVTDNLDAYYTGKDGERKFFVNHSSPDICSDTSLLFWSISQPHWDEPWNR